MGQYGGRFPAALVEFGITFLWRKCYSRTGRSLSRESLKKAVLVLQWFETSRYGCDFFTGRADELKERR